MNASSVSVILLLLCMVFAGFPVSVSAQQAVLLKGEGESSSATTERPGGLRGAGGSSAGSRQEGSLLNGRDSNDRDRARSRSLREGNSPNVPRDDGAVRYRQGAQNTGTTGAEEGGGKPKNEAPKSVGRTVTLVEGLLVDLNLDWSRTHYAAPMGVPRDYDWATKPRIEKGNDPGSFAAMTGWGHVFWMKDTIGNPGPLEIRNFQTYLCSGVDRRWERVQGGGIEGAQFRADFQGNSAKPPIQFVTDGSTSTVQFEAGTAFHFWPEQGRIRLPKAQLCGVVVLLEARAGRSQTSTGGYLIGLGADYWVDMISNWDNFRTNKGVGLGRLKQVGADWAWYGMSTASDTDLRRLYSSGLLDAVR